jgi:hypothetical protein
MIVTQEANEHNDEGSTGGGGPDGGAYENIPAELKTYPQWMCWRVGAPKADGGFQKPPVSPHTGLVAGHNEPRNRGTFEEAVAAIGRYGLSGISFVPTEADPFTLVDFDDCRDPESGEITDPEAKAWLEEARTYAEVSPSGRGVRAVARGRIPHTVNNNGVEMYSQGQQLTITGERLAGAPGEIREAQAALDGLFRRYAKRQASLQDLKIDEAEPPVVLDERGLEVWRGERPVVKDEGTGEISRSRTLYKIACTLAEAGATPRIIRGAVSERDVALGYRKYLDRPDERAEREYTRIALNATREAGRPRDYSGVLETLGGGNAVSTANLGSGRKTFTATELLEQEFAPIRWVVPGILPEGVTILGGKPKIGKSWLAFDLALGVSTRGTALGDVEVERGPALVLALEDNPRRLQRRLRALTRSGLGNRSAPGDLDFSVEWPRVGEGFEKELRVWLESRPGARLVIVDTLKKVRPRVGPNKGVYDADYEALEPLLPLSAEFGVSILVLHHTRKMDADDPLETLSGSFGLSGGADGVMVLKRDRGAHDAALHVTGRDIEDEAELALKWDGNLNRWVLMGDAEEHRRSEARRKVLWELENAEESLSRNDIAIAVDGKDETVRKLLRKMVDAGEIERVGPDNRPKYRLPQGATNPLPPEGM